jgi:hypothetical protein
MQPRSKWFLLAGFLGILLLTLATGAKEQEGKWYFLSGTPTEDTDQHYPSVLYTTGIGQKLKAIRQIVSGDDGVHSIRTYGNTAFVAYPHLPPTTVSVVHLNKPTLTDEVPFNPEAKVVIDTKLAIAEPRDRGIEELIWLVPPENRAGQTVISISKDLSDNGSRVRRDTWNEYSFLRFDGIPGGPVVQPDLVGSSEGSTLGIKVLNHYVMVDRLPVAITRRVRGEIPYYLAVDKRYLVFALQHHAADIQSGTLTKRMKEIVYVHDRKTDRWTTRSVDGSCSRTRIFGSWLATIVQFWDPNHKQNPGADQERSVETNTLPNVRQLYAIFAGHNCRIPGTLTLQNLESGAKIVLPTGEEDSEVLWVGADTVLYRINDTIYQAKIVGDQIKDPTMLVRDEDVPEIHWAFWTQ